MRMESLWPYEYMYNVLMCFNLLVQSAMETPNIFLKSISRDEFYNDFEVKILDIKNGKILTMGSRGRLSLIF